MGLDRRQIGGFPVREQRLETLYLARSVLGQGGTYQR
jgi:hypothetical protein